MDEYNKTRDIDSISDNADGKYNDYKMMKLDRHLCNNKMVIDQIPKYSKVEDILNFI